MPSRKKAVAIPPFARTQRSDKDQTRKLQKRLLADTPANVRAEADTHEVRERKSAISADARKATGISAENVAITLAIQAAAIPVGADDVEGNPAKAREIVSAAVEMLDQIKPEGALQSMLAAQMIGVHNTAIKFLLQATDKSQTFEGMDANVHRAVRLMRLFNEQLATLASLRGKTSEQKVTVEHVHVYEGGQAIVGNVAKAGALSADGGRE